VKTSPEHAFQFRNCLKVVPLRQLGTILAFLYAIRSFPLCDT
jgi:hypothetical protein